MPDALAAFAPEPQAASGPVGLLLERLNRSNGSNRSTAASRER